MAGMTPPQGGNPPQNGGNNQYNSNNQRGNTFTGREPHDASAEQAVLGSMLLDKTCIPQVVGSLKLDDFYIPLNRDIYQVIYTKFNYSMKTDPVTIKGDVQRLGNYDVGELGNYFTHLLESTPTAAHVDEYARLVKDKSLLRGIFSIAADLTQKVESNQEEGAELLEIAEQRIAALRQGRATSGLASMEVVLGEVQERLMELAENDSAVPGISTGLSDLDRATSGLNKSDLILMAARPGMGKTSMALNMLLHAGKYAKKSVAFFSLEMSREQLGMRLISTESFVDSKKLTTGQLSDNDWESVMEACSSLVQTKIYIDDDSSITVADINAKCRRLNDLGLIIIDYLQLMQSAGKKSGGGENRQQVVSDISRTLKIMAKELNVPVLCLSQLSRASEKRENKRPMLSDLRESGAIEQDADIVLFLYRDDYYDKDSESHNIAECIIAKNRHGETGTVELEWLPQFTTFRTLERHEREH